MKRLPIILSVFVFYLIPLFAQAPDTLWTKTFGGSSWDEGYYVQQTTDGGFVFLGTTQSFGAIDIWLIRTDSSGDTLWTRTYGGFDSEYGRCVKQTQDGGYIIAGYTMSYGAGSFDFWLIKTDTSGDTLWTKTFGGSDTEIGYFVLQTPDMGYAALAVTKSFGAGDRDCWLIRTDASGNTIWTKMFGGTGFDQCYSMDMTSDNGYIITGETNSFGAGGADVWLIKTDSTGDTLWTKTFGGTNTDIGYGVEQTTDGGYIIAGYTTSYGAGGSDVWLIKTNSTGDTLWTKTIGGTSADEGFSVQQTADGGYIIAGYTSSFGAGGPDIWLIKTGPTGETSWTETLGGNNPDIGLTVQQTSDRGYIIAGRTESFGAGDVDAWLIRTDSDPSAVEQDLLSLIPDNYSLKQNYPNPFNPITTIKYQIPELNFVTIKVFDVLGSEIATLVNEEEPIGSYQIEFDATILSSGVYFYRIQAGSFVETKKMVLMK